MSQTKNDIASDVIYKMLYLSGQTRLYSLFRMVFGEHWGQRLSLVLARGQADLVLGAVAAGRNNNGGAQGRKASPEWSSTDCQPCVNL